MEYEQDEVLKLKKKTPNNKKKKKRKSIEQIIKERDEKEIKEKIIENTKKDKLEKETTEKLQKLKETERSAMDFELDLLGNDFQGILVTDKTSSVLVGEDGEDGEDDEDERVSELDFM